MSAFEVSTDKAVCCWCGATFPKYSGSFYKSYASQYKGLGYIPVCRKCIEAAYQKYLVQTHDVKSCVRQMCRKFDLYWSEKAFESIYMKSTDRTIMAQYIAKTNTNSYLGKCYDDTLVDEHSLWSFATTPPPVVKEVETPKVEERKETNYEISDDIRLFWGTGLSDQDYYELEERKKYWVSRYPKGTDIDIGTETLIRQICYLEIDINKSKAEGKPIDKSINTLNTLLGSLNLKPAQNTNENVPNELNQPYGVLIKIRENKRPIPEPDEDLKDVDGIGKYVTIWLFGHLCKMLHIKNAYSRLYEEEIKKMRLEHPEYDEEDDEEFINDIFSGGGDV